MALKEQVIKNLENGDNVLILTGKEHNRLKIKF